MPEGSSSFDLKLTGVSPVGHRLLPSPRRRLGIAAGASLLLHIVLLAALLVGLAHQKRILNAADTPAVVELVMSPPGDSRTTTPATAQLPVAKKPVAKLTVAVPPPKPAHLARQRSAPAAKQAKATPPPAPSPVKAPVAVAAASVAPQPRPPEPAQAAPPAPVTPSVTKPVVTAAPEPAALPQMPPVPAAKSALQINLGGVASDTNALVTGSMMLPPTADPKFHNRKPNYPPDAAMLGQQGTVVLMVHVSPEGLVTGVDITQSSGYRMLDRAARDTVLAWHFLPALRHGRPVRFAMPIRIRFALD